MYALARVGQWLELQQPAQGWARVKWRESELVEANGSAVGSREYWAVIHTLRLLLGDVK